MRFLKLQRLESFRRRCQGRAPRNQHRLGSEPSCIWCRKVWYDAMEQTSIEKKNLKWEKKTPKPVDLCSLVGVFFTTHSCQNWIIFFQGLGWIPKKWLKPPPSSLLTGLADTGAVPPLLLLNTSTSGGVCALFRVWEHQTWSLFQNSNSLFHSVIFPLESLGKSNHWIPIWDHYFWNLTITDVLTKKSRT